MSGVRGSEIEVQGSDLSRVRAIGRQTLVWDASRRGSLVSDTSGLWDLTPIHYCSYVGLANGFLWLFPFPLLIV
jgi:hypothetical protein